ncbi:F0F1 ATP synthase subunit A [Amycolatopsis regifaucium]|uniref:ATP synthase subunit a n=1 Tax=Amycolatopsis regifaucium TaxID=546365 RepID=A0A154MHN7_9PSEU|nr:F0F1 ATP synthase subunit A [Amycolatopsis regifaucium]KZB83886.1 ATP synthase subunit A [Amycolatopsis regifaucium]OKA06670.1 ATP synthase F0 subunit A [Amycolatopsis regifaucium]SFH23412.1 ATP synthase F0 subcomplex A subunit [Amycolatopsis regifaucium]
MGALVLAGGAEFTPPGVKDFNLPPLFGSGYWLSFTKPMLLVVISLIIIVTYFMVSSRRLKVVPGKGQFIAESLYNFGRNNIAREQIGSADFKPFIPLVLGLFSFVLVNNLFGIIPFFQFPTMARIGFPVALAFLVVYPVYHYVGFKRHGFKGYLKKELAPSGIPGFVLPLYSTIEFAQKFFIAPATLAIRVFAAMFAGHLIIMVFTLGGSFLLTEGEGIVKVASPVAFLFAIAMTFLEAFIQILQAYIFALLSAGYIGAALASEH